MTGQAVAARVTPNGDSLAVGAVCGKLQAFLVMMQTLVPGGKPRFAVQKKWTRSRAHVSFRSCQLVLQARLETYTRRPTCITSSSAAGSSG